MRKMEIDENFINYLKNNGVAKAFEQYKKAIVKFYEKYTTDIQDKSYDFLNNLYFALKDNIVEFDFINEKLNNDKQNGALRELDLECSNCALSAAVRHMIKYKFNEDVNFKKIGGEVIVEKTKKWQEFLERYPFENLHEMDLSKYANRTQNNGNCFTYDLEYGIVGELGGIGGGSSLKFIIYNYKTDKPDSRVKTSGDYKFLVKFETPEQAFQATQQEICKIVQYSSQGNLEEIDKLDLFGPVIKWKIAFLYQFGNKIPDNFLDNFKIPAVYEKTALKNYIKIKNLGESDNYTEIFQKIINYNNNFYKNKYNLWDLSDDIWKEWQMVINPPKIKTHPLNQIYYGPPGTGKTYHTIASALEIIDGTINNDRATNKKRFDELLESGQIVFTTFHQSYNYEDFIQGIKPNLNGENISYQMQDGIFKEIADKARELIKTPKDGAQSLRFDELFEYLITEFDKSQELKLNTIRGVPFTIVSIEGDNLTVKLSSEREGIETKRGIKKYFAKFNPENRYGKTYLWGICNYLKQKANEIPIKTSESEQNKLKNFVIIIDEINRGNISKIFGELITLIEESKRLGNNEGLEITLPSGEEFAVPNNLYIIGTMNTADRSLAQIDLALRRRFEFIPMYPDYSLWSVGNEVRQFLEKLNDKIAVQDSEEHTIGHAFFYDNQGNILTELSQISGVFCQKIMPLLEEYFFDDPNQIKEVLGEGAFEMIYDEIIKGKEKYRKKRDWQHQVKRDFFDKILNNTKVEAETLNND